MNNIRYKRRGDLVIFEKKEFSNLVYKVAKLKFDNKDLRDNLSLYRKILVGFAITILICIACILSYSYDLGVQKCVNAGHEENYCREGLK